MTALPDHLSSLRPIENPRAFESILLQLEGAMVAGELGPGDRLPPERQLATYFAVSRASIREAVRVLEALGIVRVRRGSENGALILNEAQNGVTRILGLQLALRHISLQDVIGFRALVEAAAARSVAADPPQPLLRELGDLIEEMGTSTTGPEPFLALDVRFHLAIVAAAGNALVTLFMESARSSIGRMMLDAVSRAGDWPRLRSQLTRQHRAIADAIAAGEADRASDLTREHIYAFYRRYAR